MCKYPCGFHFADDKVSYDNGCWCGSKPMPQRMSSWDEVERHIKLQSDSGVLKRMKKFWDS